MYKLIPRLLLVTSCLLPSLVLAGASAEDLDLALETEPERASAVPQTAIETTTIATSSAGGASSDDVTGIEAQPVIQFYASDKAAELLYEIGQPVFGLNNDRSRFAVLFSEERDNALTAAFLFDADRYSLQGLRLSFGPKIIAGLLSIENADVFGLGANIEAGYVLPVKQFPLRMSAEVTYAPDILTFGQSDRIIDVSYRVGLPLTSNIEGFVGLRYLQFDTRPGERKLDQQVHLGIRWTKRS